MCSSRRKLSGWGTSGVAGTDAARDEWPGRVGTYSDHNSPNGENAHGNVGLKIASELQVEDRYKLILVM